MCSRWCYVSMPGKTSDRKHLSGISLGASPNRSWIPHPFRCQERATFSKIRQGKIDRSVSLNQIESGVLFSTNSTDACGAKSGGLPGRRNMLALNRFAVSSYMPFKTNTGPRSTFTSKTKAATTTPYTVIASLLAEDRRDLDRSATSATQIIQMEFWFSTRRNGELFVGSLATRGGGKVGNFTLQEQAFEVLLL